MKKIQKDSDMPADVGSDLLLGWREAFFKLKAHLGFHWNLEDIVVKKTKQKKKYSKSYDKMFLNFK